MTLWDALAPLRLPADLRLTPEQFELVCAENREAVLELAADGHVIAMTPTGSETSGRNSRLVMRLLLWAKSGRAERLTLHNHQPHGSHSLSALDRHRIQLDPARPLPRDHQR
ncbi:hypothetical protein [Synechococcus sp. WH 8101]|uniref:hypothetical protein n=1 Tax=Synechococcus sp. WH 8101 TaxID=59932 RepID=UPI00351C9374